MASALGLADSVRDQACELFRSAQSEELLLGRSIEAFATASLYAACRCNRVPMLLANVSAVSQVARSRVENAYRVLNRTSGFPRCRWARASTFRGWPQNSGWLQRCVGWPNG
jgi:transcription initiation factor TFIIB